MNVGWAGSRGRERGTESVTEDMVLLLPHVYHIFRQRCVIFSEMVLIFFRLHVHRNCEHCAIWTMHCQDSVISTVAIASVGSRVLSILLPSHVH